MTTMKTNRLQIIVVIAILMAIVTSCEFNPFMPIVHGMRSEPISMRVTSEKWGFDNELFYRDSIYRVGASEHYTKRFIKQEYIDNDGRIDTIEVYKYMLGFNTTCYSSSLGNDAEINIYINIAGNQPWKIGQTYHLNALDDDYMRLFITYEREGFELAASQNGYSIDGWIRLNSHKDSDMIDHSDFDGEFEMTLIGKDNPNDCIFVKNGVFINAPFHYPNRNIYDSITD